MTEEGKIVRTKTDKFRQIMTTITVNVTGMMCGHCEAHVTKAVKEAFGVEDVVSSHEKDVYKRQVRFTVRELSIFVEL